MGKRKIVVNGETWEYSIGKSYVAARNLTTNERRHADLSQVTGWDWGSIERSLYKGGNWAVRPRNVEKWLSTPVKPVPTKPK